MAAANVCVALGAIALGAAAAANGPLPTTADVAAGADDPAWPALAHLLDGLDPRSRDLALRVQTERFGGGLPNWPGDRPFHSVVATARFAGDAFIIESVTTDLTRGNATTAETIAFDGERSFSRAQHSEGWLLVSRLAPLSPDLQHLGFIDQSGRGMGFLAADRRWLAEDLARAIELERSVRDGVLHVAYTFPQPDGTASRRGRFEIAMEHAPPPTGGVADAAAAQGDRMVAFGDQSFSVEPGEAPVETRRGGMRALRWESFDGVALPVECEYRVEHRQPGGHVASNRVSFRILEARRSSPEEVHAAIDAFAQPRAGETVFETDLRLQYRVGERRFLLEGVHYEAESPLVEIPGGTVPEILSKARRLDGGWREVDAEGAAPAPPSSAVHDGIRWLQFALGAGFIVLGLVIWRRA